MISERLVFCIFPKNISTIDKYYKVTNKKSKWFSILIAIDDTTLIHTHYFNVKSFEANTRG